VNVGDNLLNLIGTSSTRSDFGCPIESCHSNKRLYHFHHGLGISIIIKY
jgi:hypothetical protein